MASLKSLPSPEHHWLLGNMPEFNADTLSFIEHAASLGDLVRIKFGPFWLYFVNHPDTIHEILVTKAKYFHKSRRLKWALGGIIGENVFTSDGDYWKQQRKLMQPSFHYHHISAYADTMVEYAQQAIESWQENDELDIDEIMTATAMNVITKTMFGGEVGSEAHRIGELLTELFVHADVRNGVLLGYPLWLPTESNRRLKEVVSEIRNFLRNFIDKRRKSGEDTGDLLSMLLMAQDEAGLGMTDEQVMNEAVTIFGAGHETTAYTLTWAWYALSQNSEVEAKLHEELDTVLNGRPPALEDLKQLTYTDKVIKETLRLYPTAFAITRQIAETVKIGDYKFPKNNVLMIAPWTLGRDSRWFPNPLEFNPDRWTSEFEAEMPKYAYIPFGAGPRVCIGNQFALMEAKLILATIAQQFSLSLKPNFQTKPHRAFTLRPDNGMKMIAHVRERVPIA